MALAVAFAPGSPTSLTGILITCSGQVDPPATVAVIRDSDSKVVARSVVFGNGQVFGYTDATATLTIDATGGTYKLTVDGHQTAAIAFGANAAAIEAAITLAVGAAVVHVTGSGPFTLASEGTDLNIAETVTSDATSLTGGGHTATIAPVVVGGVGKYLDDGGPFQFGPLFLPTDNYHLDVQDGSNASLLGSTVACVIG